jgi:lambda family phage portal protein
MGFIDRLINTVSPRWAYERQVWRDAQASYKGGTPTRLSERWGAEQGFRFGTTGDRQQVVDARSRAYNAYRQNPVARTLIETERDNVIGDGLNFQPASKSGGKSGWNDEAKDRYYLWRETCSVRGPDLVTGCEVERELWGRSRVAGDIGWILVSRGADSRIQIVPAENIVTPDGMYADPAVYDGIRFDSYGAPLAYHVLSTSERTAKRDFVQIPARDFVFLPHFTEPNQARGVTAYMTIFDLLAHLDRYVDGVSLAAWMATVMGIIFKQNNAAKQVQGLNTLANSQGVQQKAVTFENGMVKYIGTDEDVAQVQASQPMQQTPEFIRTMYRMLGQPFDMPLEVIAKDMSTCTFASARIGLLPFYRSCRIKAARFASRWGRTIRWWLSRERLRAQDDPKRWKTPFPEDFLNFELLPNEWDYTDPVSEVQSDMLQIDAGFKSHQMVVSERGRDGERILRERREWLAQTADLPRVFSTMTRDPAPEPEPAAEPTDTTAADEAKFKRDAWLGFQRDGTVADVAANLTDLKALTKEVGLPVNEEYTEPYLPVVADPGPLVTGDTIQDPDGDIVGGDREEAAAELIDRPSPAPDGAGEDDVDGAAKEETDDAPPTGAADGAA